MSPAPIQSRRLPQIRLRCNLFNAKRGAPPAPAPTVQTPASAPAPKPQTFVFEEDFSFAFDGHYLAAVSALLTGASLVLSTVIGVGVLLLNFAGFKTALARQVEMPVRVPQWYVQLGEQITAWSMIFWV